MRALTSLLLVSLATAIACSAKTPQNAAAPDAASPSAGTAVPASMQRAGDPNAGYAALVNNGYVGCGLPYTAYSMVFGAAPADQQLPGRNAKNATLPYNLTRFTTADGVDVVGPNCLQCHAAPLLGKIVVGLGDTFSDYTYDATADANLAQGLLTDPKEKAELAKVVDRTGALRPYIQTLTIGVNPADNLAAVLFSHRDPMTLAWSESPLLALPPKIVVPVDVPPWWRMSKKNAMFYTAAGRGDHARIMMTASTLCVDSVDVARTIDAYFGDVRAFIASLAPPKYPFAVDASLAAHGKTVFDVTCSSCHGTYGANASYPNLVISVDDVGTDNTLATGATQFADAYVSWFNSSFYGQAAQLVPMKGYYAPPLDGIWATAPYLHNGSVPTLAALLDSSQRPKFFVRSYDSNDYDQKNVGWNFKAQATGQSAEPDATKKKYIYDTTQLGYSNAGHTYGDALSDADRAALLEYLKLL